MKITARGYRGLVFGLAITFIAAASSTAKADVLYTNGPVNGDYSAWNIGDDSLAESVADSFTLVSGSILGTIDFTAWTDGGGVTSVNWAITSSPFGGTTLASGTASTASVLDAAISPNGVNFNVYAETFDTGGLQLNSGTYWLQLSGAENAGDAPGSAVVFWDENDGPSQADSYSASNLIASLANATCGFACGQSGSETFDINSVAATPEPGTVVLLLSGLAFAGYRKITAGRAPSARQ